MRNFFRSLKTAVTLRERHTTPLPNPVRTPRNSGDLVPTDSRPPGPPEGSGSGMPQFPGLGFDDHGIDFVGEAECNELAIRAALIHFKNTWPGRCAVLEGSTEFRLRVWRLAEEHGVPIEGPHPLATNLPARPRTNASEPTAASLPRLPAR